MMPSLWQILIVLLVVVVLFGAKKLPEIGGGLGKAIRNFKKATSEPDEIDITPKSAPKSSSESDSSKNSESK
ncbi:MAG: twin-arginine translocase TatA/TatE family subunit [Deltaproteobacteria bacterium]|jgi:sec-independent protein translocase protein TatA|nr:twin-arginine translocase TatA/TatE family subunit [Deltaproteobacteria bacterium]